MASTPRAPDTVLSYYFPTTLAVLLLTMGKQGARLNYFFEPTLAGLAYLLDRGRRLPARAHSRPVLVVPLFLFLGAYLLDYQQIAPKYYGLPSPAATRGVESFLQTLEDELRRVDGPSRRLLFSPFFHVNLSLQIGRPLFVNDPLAYNDLWSQGKLLIDPLVAAVKEGYFDVVLLPAGEDLTQPRFPLQAGTEALDAAVGDAYRLVLRGLFDYYRRRDGT